MPRRPPSAPANRRTPMPKKAERSDRDPRDRATRPPRAGAGDAGEEHGASSPPGPPGSRSASRRTWRSSRSAPGSSLVVAMVATDDEDIPIDARLAARRWRVVARVLNRLNLPGGTIQATLQGLMRVKLESVRFEDGYYTAFPRLVDEETPATEAEAEQLVERILTTLGGIGAQDRAARRRAAHPPPQHRRPGALRRPRGDPRPLQRRREGRGAAAARRRASGCGTCSQWLEAGVGADPGAGRRRSEPRPARRGRGGGRRAERPERATDPAGRSPRCRRSWASWTRRERRPSTCCGASTRRSSPRAWPRVARREAERLRTTSPPPREAAEIRNYLDVVLDAPLGPRDARDGEIDLAAVRDGARREAPGAGGGQAAHPGDPLRGHAAGERRRAGPLHRGPAGRGQALAGRRGRARASGGRWCGVELGGRGEAQLVGQPPHPQRRPAGQADQRLPRRRRARPRLPPGGDGRDRARERGGRPGGGDGGVPRPARTARSSWTATWTSPSTSRRRSSSPPRTTSSASRGACATTSSRSASPATRRRRRWQIAARADAPAAGARSTASSRGTWWRSTEETLVFLTRGYARDAGLGQPAPRALGDPALRGAPEGDRRGGAAGRSTREMIEEVLGIPRYPTHGGGERARGGGGHGARLDRLRGRADVHRGAEDARHRPPHHHRPAGRGDARVGERRVLLRALARRARWASPPAPSATTTCTSTSPWAPRRRTAPRAGAAVTLAIASSPRRPPGAPRPGDDRRGDAARARSWTSAG